jgi:serine protease Do
MTPTVRFWSFAGALAGGLAVAVSSLGAHGQGAPRDGEMRRDVRVFDAQGARLGVMVRDLEGTETTATGGVKIDSVDANSPAGKAGLQAGDIVVEYDGERVRSARQFTRLVQETPEGREVPLAVLRNGERHALKATPEARGMAFGFDIDPDQIHREVERGLGSIRSFRLPPDVPLRPDDFMGERMPGRGGRLGVSVDSLTDQLAQYFGATDGGALVTTVRKDSPAEKAGLRAGDVVTSVNGDRVRSAGDLLRGVARIDEGEVTLEYLRDRKAGSTKATLEPRPATREITTPRWLVLPAGSTRGK